MCQSYDCHVILDDLRLVRRLVTESIERLNLALEENLIDVISSFLLQIQQSTVKNVEFPLSFARKGWKFLFSYKFDFKR